jgi:NAD(P)-dependent dehydrogenase (short-subunit alcohol dehydrogenase family)
MPASQRSAVVLGARNVGAAVAARLVADGWRVTAVARSRAGLAGVAGTGARTATGDAADPYALREVLDAATRAQGGLDLVVNAVNASRPPAGGVFGGGPVLDADLATFRGWSTAVAEQAFVFLACGAAALLACAEHRSDPDAGDQVGPTGGSGRRDRGILVQITGGSSLRPVAGRGSWAAGAAATRALTLSAAQELLAVGVHVALLVVDGMIAPRPAGTGPGDHPELREIAHAVAALAAPGRVRGSHELVLSRLAPPE